MDNRFNQPCVKTHIKSGITNRINHENIMLLIQYSTYSAHLNMYTRILQIYDSHKQQWFGQWREFGGDM